MQLFREKVLILLKDKRFLKFLTIGERWRTAANGGEPLRTAICRSFFEVTNGQNSIIFQINSKLYISKIKRMTTIHL